MDEQTQKAFSRLWTLWKSNQDIDGTEETWNNFLAEVEAVYNAADTAKDPEFIREFCLSVVNSVQRIYKQNN